MKYKITKDEIIIIVTIVVIAVVLISIKLYSGSMYKGKPYETSLSENTTVQNVVEATTEESIKEVVATVETTVLGTQNTQEKTTTTEKYEIIEDIKDKVVEYDKEEDALAHRKPQATVMPQKPQVQETTQSTEEIIESEFVMVAPKYDENGNIIYTLTKKEETVLSKDLAAYLGTETETVIVQAEKGFVKITGYVYETTKVGNRKETVVSKLIVAKNGKEESTEEPKAEDTTKESAKEDVSQKETESETESVELESSSEEESTEATTANTEDVTKTTEKNSVEPTSVVLEGNSPSESVSQPVSEEEMVTKENEVESKTEVATENTDEEDDIQYYIYTLEAQTVSTVVDGWYENGGKKYYYYNEEKYATGYTDIDGEKYYFNSQGELSSKRGIDVSLWQGEIDWKAVKASGIDFVIVRAGVRRYGNSGQLSVDEKFEENVQGALEAGLEVGAYIFSQAVTEAEALEEASLIVTMCKGYNITLPLVIDVEEVDDKKARQNNISVEQRTKIINVFAQVVRSSGYTPMLYTGASWYRTSIDGTKLNMDNWIAKWSEVPPSEPHIMWQYSEVGKVPGISVDVDLNIWITDK